jgi:hypothetical protein
MQSGKKGLARISVSCSWALRHKRHEETCRNPTNGSYNFLHYNCKWPTPCESILSTQNKTHLSPLLYCSPWMDHFLIITFNIHICSFSKYCVRGPHSSQEGEGGRWCYFLTYGRTAWRCMISCVNANCRVPNLVCAVAQVGEAGGYEGSLVRHHGGCHRVAAKLLPTSEFHTDF